MTVPVDVLAVMDQHETGLRSAPRLTVKQAERVSDELREARAAVAELISAASNVPVEYDYHGNPAAPEWARFVAALARCGGSA